MSETHTTLRGLLACDVSLGDELKGDEGTRVDVENEDDEARSDLGALGCGRGVLRASSSRPPTPDTPSSPSPSIASAKRHRSEVADSFDKGDDRAALAHRPRPSVADGTRARLTFGRT